MLLKNDSVALGLEPQAPTYSATNEGPSRQVKKKETG
jgi:hypothetical protein